MEFSDEAGVVDLKGEFYNAFHRNSYIARIVKDGETQSVVVLPPNARVARPIEDWTHQIAFAAGSAAALGQRLAVIKPNGDIDVSFPLR